MRFGLFACFFALGCAATQDGAVDPNVRFVPLSPDSGALASPTAGLAASSPAASTAPAGASIAASAGASAVPTSSAIAPTRASVGFGSAPVAGPSPTLDDEEDGAIDFEESGSLSAAQSALMKVLGRCFVRALDRGEESSGALWVQLSVAGDGHVDTVLLAEGFSPYVKTCASPKLKALSFPESSEELRTLRFPINELASEPREPEN